MEKKKTVPVTADRASSKRHAYMIMAHGNLSGLDKLISVLDDTHNDIYVHIDKKTKCFHPERYTQYAQHARVVFVDRVKVNWGGFSQIKAELVLLKEATKTQHQYYHLLSGMDFPLKPQAEIREFFTVNEGKEFIRFDKAANQSGNFLDRVRYYYFFQNQIGRNKGLYYAILEKAQRYLLLLQKRLRIDRTKHSDYKMYKGTNWFSITHNMALFVLQNEKNIERYFRFGFCADEVFLQTIVMVSPYKENIVNNSLRFIDWDRGTPYTFTICDYDALISNSNLFARKFNYEQTLTLINKLYTHLTSNQTNNNEVTANDAI